MGGLRGVIIFNEVSTEARIRLTPDLHSNVQLSLPVQTQMDGLINHFVFYIPTLLDYCLFDLNGLEADGEKSGVLS